MNIGLKLDISKLSPAPWHVEDYPSSWPSITSGPADDANERRSIDDPMEVPDMVMCALARNFLDITMRRGCDMMEFNWQNIVGSTVRNLPTMLDESPQFRGQRVWLAVAEICGLGGTAATELCKELGVDPDAIVGMRRHCNGSLKAKTKDGCTTGSCSQRPSVQRRNWEGAK